MKEMEAYVDATQEEMIKIARKVAREGRKKLIASSPRGTKSKRRYADGWSVKYEIGSNGKFYFTVHNKTKPGLTHLLEKGHQSNKPSVRWVPAKPHIKKVEEWCNEEFVRRVEEMLEK